jgi:biopolymer transport protein ExbB
MRAALWRAPAPLASETRQPALAIPLDGTPQSRCYKHCRRGFKAPLNRVLPFDKIGPEPGDHGWIWSQLARFRFSSYSFRPCGACSIHGPHDARAFIYITLAVLAVWGAYNVILLYRSLRQKSLRAEAAGTLIGQVRERCLNPKGPDVEGALTLCTNPPYWHTALAQLIAVALRRRDLGLSKIKQTLVMEFHTEVVATMETRLATISTIVRMGPLLGLLGTVASMIAAFGRIGGAERVNPSALASDISLALWATAGGLVIATIMMIFGNDIHARLRHLRDRTERQLHDVLEILETMDSRATASRSTTGRGAPTPR